MLCHGAGLPHIPAMKPFLATALLTLFAVASRADIVIESKIESPQMNSAIITKIKNDTMRSDIASGPMGAMSSIIDTKTGASITLIHTQKMAMKTTGEQTKAAIAMSKQLTGADPNAPAAKPVATGQVEKVGEYDCEIYTVKNDTMETKFWVAKNHPQAAALKASEEKMRQGMLGLSLIHI